MPFDAYEAAPTSGPQNMLQPLGTTGIAYCTVNAEPSESNWALIGASPVPVAVL